MRPKVTQAPGVSQEEVDKTFAQRLDEKLAENKKLEQQNREAILADILSGKSKAPRMAAGEAEKVKRESRPKPETGLRY